MMFSSRKARERTNTDSNVDEAHAEIRALTRELERAIDRLEHAIDRIENGHD